MINNIPTISFIKKGLKQQQQKQFLQLLMKTSKEVTGTIFNFYQNYFNTTFCLKIQ